MFLTDTLANILQNSFAYSFVSEHYKHFFYFDKKNAVFAVGEGVTLSCSPYIF